MGHVSVSFRAAAALAVLALSFAAVYHSPAKGQQAPPSAPVTVLNTAANPVPVSAPQPLPVAGSVGLTGPVAVQQSGSWTVTAEETFAPGRSPKRYGPISAEFSGSLVGHELVPPVEAGRTFILTHLNALGVSNNSAVPLVQGACILQLRVGSTYTPFMELQLVYEGSALSISQPVFLPLASGEGLYVNCIGSIANGTQPFQTHRVTAGGYFVPAAD